LTHSLKPPGFNNPCAYKLKSRFQAFAFKFNLYLYTTGVDAAWAVCSAINLVDTILHAGSASGGGAASAEAAAAAAAVDVHHAGRGKVGLYELNSVYPIA
jgi:hypothetical protein